MEEMLLCSQTDRLTTADRAHTRDRRRTTGDFARRVRGTQQVRIRCARYYLPSLSLPRPPLLAPLQSGRDCCSPHSGSRMWKSILIHDYSHVHSRNLQSGGARAADCACGPTPLRSVNHLGHHMRVLLLRAASACLMVGQPASMPCPLDFASPF